MARVICNQYGLEDSCIHSKAMKGLKVGCTFNYTVTAKTKDTTAFVNLV